MFFNRCLQFINNKDSTTLRFQVWVRSAGNQLNYSIIISVLGIFGVKSPSASFTVTISGGWGGLRPFPLLKNRLPHSVLFRGWIVNKLRVWFFARPRMFPSLYCQANDGRIETINRLIWTTDRNPSYQSIGWLKFTDLTLLSLSKSKGVLQFLHFLLNLTRLQDFFFIKKLIIDFIKEFIIMAIVLSLGTFISLSLLHRI